MLWVVKFFWCCRQFVLHVQQTGLLENETKEWKKLNITVCACTVTAADWTPGGCCLTGICKMSIREVWAWSFVSVNYKPQGKEAGLMSHYRPVFILTMVGVDWGHLKAHYSASPTWCDIFIQPLLIMYWEFLYENIFDKVIVSELV